MSDTEDIKVTRPVNKLLVTIAVMSATIMQVLDTTIVNVALPEMQGAFLMLFCNFAAVKYKK